MGSTQEVSNNMERAVRYRDQKRAIEVGHRLSDHYFRDVMTGLSFLIEPDQAVIVIAAFDHPRRQPHLKEVDSLMLPGEIIQKSLSDLIHSMPPNTMMLLGDGLKLFEVYYRARHDLDPRDPIIL